MEELKLAIERINGLTYTDAEMQRIVRTKNEATGKLKEHLELAINCLTVLQNQRMIEAEYKQLCDFAGMAI